MSDRPQTPGSGDHGGDVRDSGVGSRCECPSGICVAWEPLARCREWQGDVSADVPPPPPGLSTEGERDDDYYHPGDIGGCLHDHHDASWPATQRDRTGAAWPVSEPQLYECDDDYDPRLGVYTRARERRLLQRPGKAERRLWNSFLDRSRLRPSLARLQRFSGQSGQRGAGTVRTGWVAAVEHARGLWSGVKK